MRKNEVDKTITPISGGVLAVEGFKINVLSTGIKESGEEDFAIIYSENRIPAGCVFSNSAIQGAGVRVSKNNFKKGYLQAVITHSGIVYPSDENGEAMAKSVCTSTAMKLRIERNQTVVACTGKIGEKLPVEKLLQNVKPLLAGLTDDVKKIPVLSRALNTTDKSDKAQAYTFKLGDYTCKIGVACKGSYHVCPNLSTTLCFLTCDVNISPEMLQKAITSAVNDTFNVLNIDGVSSPNDMVCILSNGKAGNAKIENADLEYKKFTYALTEVLWRVCKSIAKDNLGNKKLLICNTAGAKSKSTAKTIAKTLVGAVAVRKMFAQKRIDLETLIYSIASANEKINLTECKIHIKTKKDRYVLFEDGKTICLSPSICDSIFDENEISLDVEIGGGNYHARAMGITL